MVCSNTISVSTCQVEFVLWRTVLFFYYREVDLSDCSGDFSALKRTVLLIDYYLSKGRQLAVTTTLSQCKTVLKI